MVPLSYDFDDIGKWKINICERHSANDLGPSSNPEHPGSKRLYHD